MAHPNVEKARRLRAQLRARMNSGNAGSSSRKAILRLRIRVAEIEMTAAYTRMAKTPEYQEFLLADYNPFDDDVPETPEYEDWHEKSVRWAKLRKQLAEMHTRDSFFERLYGEVA